MKNPYAKYIKYLERQAKTGTVIVERNEDYYFITENYTSIKVPKVEYELRFHGELLFSGIELENGQHLSIRKNVRGAVENTTSFARMFNTEGYSEFKKSPFTFSDKERDIAIFIPATQEHDCAVWVNTKFLGLLDDMEKRSANGKSASAPVMFGSLYGDSVFLVSPVRAPLYKPSLEELYAFIR